MYYAHIQFPICTSKMSNHSSSSSSNKAINQPKSMEKCCWICRRKNCKNIELSNCPYSEPVYLRNYYYIVEDAKRQDKLTEAHQDFHDIMDNIIKLIDTHHTPYMCEILSPVILRLCEEWEEKECDKCDIRCANRWEQLLIIYANICLNYKCNSI